VSNDKFTYLNYIRKCNNLEKLPKEFYNIDKTKTLLFPDNFDLLFKPFFKFRQNPWLPNEIKRKLEFLNIYGSYKMIEFDNSKYVKLNINNGESETWHQTFPKFTFEMFSINLADLLSTISKWLSDHSNIKVDFNLMEKP
jgi:hypothetical protein